MVPSRVGSPSYGGMAKLQIIGGFLRKPLGFLMSSGQIAVQHWAEMG